MVAPPFGQEGGPEVVCKHLTNALLKKGVNVTLFAPADWDIGVKNVPTLPTSLWRMNNFKNQTDVYRRNLIFASQLEVIKYQDDFDIIHLHAHRSAYAVGRLLKKPCVITLHNIIEDMELQQIKDIGIHPVAISKGRKERNQTPTVIENGIDTTKIGYSLNPKKYLLCVGRILEMKGIDLAIKIAKKAGKKLVIIGRIGDAPKRQLYFKKKIKPYLNKNIILKEQMPQPKLYEYLKDSEALLFPIRGKLTLFPLVVMEALASGTPAIGTPIQALPKHLNNSSVFCLSDKFDDWVKAAKNIEQFDRKACREYAEKNFDSSVMAEKYIQLYNRVMLKSSEKNNSLLSY